MQDSANSRASPGGTPGARYEDLEDTLIREAFEENQVRVRRGETAYLGYQEVHRPGRAPYAQVRMAGVCAEFAPRAPDPDGGRTCRRYMAALSSAPGILGWGRPVELQAKAAALVARQWAYPPSMPRRRQATRTDRPAEPTVPWPGRTTGCWREQFTEPGGRTSCAG
jgi:hypothetical protein